MYLKSIIQYVLYKNYNLFCLCSGRKCLQADAEEDQFTDLLHRMDLLTNLLSKDFIDFPITGDANSAGSNEVDAAAVVLYGLGIVVPLMNAEFLKASPHFSHTDRQKKVNNVTNLRSYHLYVNFEF